MLPSGLFFMIVAKCSDLGDKLSRFQYCEGIPLCAWVQSVTFLALLALVIGVLSALSLVLVGLVEAPWPLLLVGLVAVLYGLQRLTTSAVLVEPVASQSNSPASSSPLIPPQSQGSPEGVVAGTTQMVYRGVRFQEGEPSAPPPSTAESAASMPDELIYRGVRYRHDHQA